MFITVLQFFLSLSILVVLHELGHFSAAKWFKTRVEKFYLFFNPGFALFKKQIGETEYGVGWLPLGGYVKIAGMIDESFDSEQMKQEPQPWEFRSKPAWQRLIIMIGGVFVNAVLGVFLYTVVFLVWGDTYIKPSEIKDGIAVTELAYDMGLRDGDMILKVGDRDFDKFNAGILKKELIINGADNILVKREGSNYEIKVAPEVISQLSKYENSKDQLISPRFPYVLGAVTENRPAAAAGMKVGDRIVSVNGTATPYVHEVTKALRANGEEAMLTVVVQRGAQMLTKELTKEENRIWVQAKGINSYVEVSRDKYSLGKAIPAGWNKALTFLGDQVKAFGQMFTGKIKAKDSLGSFITIGSMFGTDWDWERFWLMTANLSLLLGFMNLLPIPALDGGYVMFLLFESITGIKVPDNVMEKATMAGFFLLIILMIYAMGLDISRLF